MGNARGARSYDQQVPQQGQQGQQGQRQGGAVCDGRVKGAADTGFFGLGGWLGGAWRFLRNGATL